MADPLIDNYRKKSLDTWEAMAPIWAAQQEFRSRTSGERSAFTVASFSFVTMSRWVFAGAATACQEVTTSAGNPASDVVGTFGSWGFRAFAVTASAFIRLPRM